MIDDNSEETTRTVEVTQTGPTPPIPSEIEKLVRDEIGKEKDKFQDKIEEIRNQIIITLGVFSSIVAFILVNVVAIKSFDNWLVTLTIVTSLGILLVLFNYILGCMLPTQKSKMNILIIILLIVLLLVVNISAFYFDKNPYNGIFEAMRSIALNNGISTNEYNKITKTNYKQGEKDLEILSAAGLISRDENSAIRLTEKGKQIYEEIKDKYNIHSMKK